jgi:endonuclease YncB( thermonuclease family)
MTCRGRKLALTLLAVFLLCQSLKTRASDVVEYGIVIDGKTLLIEEVRIRLAGIDAPELGQRCRGQTNIEWPCGLAAKRMLAGKIGGKRVSCRKLHLDESDHPTATCVASSGDDLSAAMVRAGYALAVGPDHQYLAEEAAARVAGAGMWLGSFQTPWEWRAQQFDPLKE